MLTDLHIKNFILVDVIHLTFQAGLTIITGETGAGKSIMFDALSLVLGARADSKFIRQGATQCEIIAAFDLQQLPAAQHWLRDNHFTHEECILKRIIQSNGRSQCFINDTPCALKSIRELANYLIDIHGQHEHHLLLQTDYQRNLLDAYGGHTALCQHIHMLYQQWHEKQNQLEQLISQQDQRARQEFLNYQIQELATLDIADNEINQLEQTLKRLHHSTTLQQHCAHALALLEGDDQQNVLQQFAQLQKLLAAIQAVDPQIKITADLLEQALIPCQELATELKHYFEQIDVNPAHLQQVESRLQSIYHIARKHQLSPQELPQHLIRLQTELASLHHNEAALAAVQQEITALTQDYTQQAQQLHTQRALAATKLAAAVTAKLAALGMSTCRLTIDLIAYPANKLMPHGSEKIEFLVSTHPSQPAGRLSEIASGGELSRLSLAIQVAVADQYATPTLLLDEIDVGIGGSTAAIVGQLLRRLATKTQILCITHLPQVAACGHQHLFVQKQINSDASVAINLDKLEKEDKIQEIARMLGGVKMTAQTLAHAKEMLEGTEEEAYSFSE